MKKNILLLDTNFSAKPIYDFLKKTGDNVFVLGGNSNDFLAKKAEDHIHLNYSNLNEVKQLIKSLKIDYIVPGGNDLSYQVCSLINEELHNFFNIDSIKVNEIINNKEKFRAFATDTNLHVPKIIDIDNFNTSLPVIVKPVDAYSGHGMTIIYENNKNLLTSAIDLAKKYSKSGKYIVEEFIQGQLYSHSAFIVDGNIIHDFIVEEHCNANQFTVDSSFLDYNFNQALLESIRNDISLMSKNLNLCDGLVHTQFVVFNNKFWIIEVTRRCPGDLYSQLIEFSTGFPYAEYYARPFLNEKNCKCLKKLDNKHILRHTISLKEDGYFNSLVFDKPINIYKYVPLALAGDAVKTSPFGRIGLLFIYCEHEKMLKEILDRAINRKLYSVDK